MSGATGCAMERIADELQRAIAEMTHITPIQQGLHGTGLEAGHVEQIVHGARGVRFKAARSSGR